MSDFVHLKVEYYPKGERQKTHFKLKTDARKWDKRTNDERVSFVRGALQVAGGVGSRYIKYTETRRTKT